MRYSVHSSNQGWPRPIIETGRVVVVVAALGLIALASNSIGCTRNDPDVESQSNRMPHDTVDSQADSLAGAERDDDSLSPAVDESINQSRADGAAAAPDPLHLRDQALQALNDGDSDRALELVRHASRLAQDNPHVKFALALVLGQRQRFPEAIQLVDQAVADAPELQLPALGQSADWLVRFGKYRQAEQKYLAILEQVPDSYLVHRRMARLHLRQGRRFDALQHLSVLCEAGEIEEWELRSLLRIAAPFAGDTERELNDPIAPTALALNHLANGELESARKILETQTTDQASSVLGTILVAESDIGALKTWLNQAVDSSQPTSDWLYARGVLAAHQKQHTESIHLLAKCLLSDPTNSDAYRWISESLDALGQTEEANRFRTRAVLVERTRTLGNEMAASAERDGQKISELIESLDRLGRRYESLAWREILLGYASQMGTLPANTAQQMGAEIQSQRSELRGSGEGVPSPQQILCELDLDSI